MKNLLQFGVLIIVIVNATAEYFKNYLFLKENSRKLNFYQQDEDLSTNAAHLFYEFIGDYLKNQSILKPFEQRIGCIIKVLRDENVFRSIDESSYHISTNEQNNSTTINFYNLNEVMNKLQPNISTANLYCLIPGIFSIIIICLILVMLITCQIYIINTEKTLQNQNRTQTNSE